LRSGIRFLLIAVVLGLAGTAQAEEFTSCWVATEIDRYGFTQQVTRCRIAGGDVVDYASDTSVPSRLYPSAGTDLTGECWYLTSAVTNWVYLGLFVNGDAILGWDPDPGPGPVALATGRIPRCTSEPSPLADPTTQVWQYVTEYIHPPPSPEVNPTPGNGITGLDTYVGVAIPEDHETQLASATGVTLDVFIEVSGIEIDWGDSRVDNFPADAEALSGYPDGVAVHIYEVKDDSGYDLEISYAWTARWRIAGGIWEFLSVPDTTTSVDYPVAEIVSVITD